MRVAFLGHPQVYRNWGYSFDGSSRRSGVGGSESTLIALAEALVAAGDDVSVYANPERPATVRGVRYRVAEEIGGRTFDALVLFRFGSGLAAQVDAGRRVLWAHDEPGASPLFRHEDAVPAVDTLVAVSPFRRRRLATFGLARGLGDLSERIVVMPNGVGAGDYACAGSRPKVWHRFIYCSVPDRGPDNLLRLWPIIRALVPDATLSVTGGWSLWGGTLADIPASHLPGVLWHGVITRTELVQRQLDAELHVHPCAFEENFCIASMECQAAGAPSVVTRVGALPTTVLDGETGIVVGGDVTDPGFTRPSPGPRPIS